MGVKYSNMRDGSRKEWSPNKISYDATITVTTTKGLIFKTVVVEDRQIFKPAFSVFWYFIEDGEALHYNQMEALERVYFHQQGW